MPYGDHTIRVVIADDEGVVRDGIRIMLESQPDITIVGTAGDGDHALRLCTEMRPDVLMLDVRMPGRNGLEVLAELVARGLVGPDAIRVLMLTTFDMEEYVDEALTSGASGFLLKSSSYEELTVAVRATAVGDGALSPSVARRIIRDYAATRRAEHTDPADLARIAELTTRERDVLALIGEGLSNGEIAEHLTVSGHTVKSHVSRLLTKTGCRDRAQAAVLARRTATHLLLPPSGDCPDAGLPPSRG
ncbi:response regulator [Streptomyces radicis]|uniref:DNA-binding response regulator n=1 Tax=Streptomyces radicis TaxID=1750517 RepID=A0A3A9WJT2_9ACTN|nr:response regulator transcription factor [Streptomyces radicis]RKN12852.1 DNA-binding response regulator [Streptomyces radicis]RKN27383.1 DNA-binding response regulator [Streptomyces radicis]